MSARSEPILRAPQSETEKVMTESTRQAMRAAGLDPAQVRRVIENALVEDLGPDFLDVTSVATIPAEQTDTADLVAFIEVYAVATKLSTRHLHQVAMSAVNEGVDSVLVVHLMDCIGILPD